MYFGFMCLVASAGKLLLFSAVCNVNQTPDEGGVLNVRHWCLL